MAKVKKESKKKKIRDSLTRLNIRKSEAGSRTMRRGSSQMIAPKSLVRFRSPSNSAVHITEEVSIPPRGLKPVGPFLDFDELETIVRIVDYDFMPEIGRQRMRRDSKKLKAAADEITNVPMNRESKMVDIEHIFHDEADVGVDGMALTRSMSQLSDMSSDTISELSRFSEISESILEEDWEDQILKIAAEYVPKEKEFGATQSIEIEMLKEWKKQRRRLQRRKKRKGKLREVNSRLNIDQVPFKTRRWHRFEKDFANLAYRDSLEDNVIIYLEEDMNAFEPTWITRDEFKAQIGKTTMQRLMAYLKKVLEHGSTTDQCFTKFEFAAMILLHEFNLTHYGHLGDNLIKYGTCTTMLVHTIILICVEMPFIMKIMTMASFSKAFILRFFEAVPLLKGVAYCTFFFFIVMQSEIAILFEGAFRLLMYLVTTSEDWRYCPEKVIGKTCIQFNDTKLYNQECPKTRARFDDMAFYSTQFFMQFVIFTQQQEKDAFLLKYGAAFIWLIILAVAINGIALIKKTTIRLHIIAFVPPASMFFGILLFHIYTITSDATMIHEMYFPWRKFFTPQFYMDTINVNTKMHQLPYLIWVCAMKPADANIETYSTTVIGVTILISWLIASIFIICLVTICKTYHISPNCFYIFPEDHIFSLIPDLLLNLAFSKSWIFLWFTSILYFYAIYVVYTINVIVDTLGQNIAIVRKYPLILCVCVWMLFFFCRYLRTNSTLLIVFEYFHPEKFEIVNSVLFGLFAFGLQFFYGQTRFNDDYIFFVGVRPKRIWVVMWHLIVYLGVIGMLIGIVTQFIQATTLDQAGTQMTQVFVTLVASFFVLLVILVFFVRRTCYWLYRKREREAFNPEPTWGPPDDDLRTLRRYYFSARDMRHRQRVVACTHRCLLRSPKYGLDRYTQLIMFTNMFAPKAAPRKNLRVHIPDVFDKDEPMAAIEEEPSERIPDVCDKDEPMVVIEEESSKDDDSGQSPPTHHQS